KVPKGADFQTAPSPKRRRMRNSQKPVWNFAPSALRPVSTSVLERADLVSVSTSMRRIALLCVALMSVAAGPSRGAAQAAAPTVVPAHLDSLVHRLPVDSTRLQAAHLVYRSMIERDTTTTVIGD